MASFNLTLDGIAATLTANVGVLNRTSAAFGINIEGTSCGGLENSAEIDDGCSSMLMIPNEAVSVTFDQDVILETLKVSSFGFNDVGLIEINGAPDIDVTSTGIQSLGDTLLGAGDSFTLSYISGNNGFSFDNFTVSGVPIPEPHAALVFGIGLLLVARRTRRRS